MPLSHLVQLQGLTGLGEKGFGRVLGAAALTAVTLGAETAPFPPVSTSPRSPTIRQMLTRAGQRGQVIQETWQLLQVTAHG